MTASTRPAGARRARPPGRAWRQAWFGTRDPRTAARLAVAVMVPAAGVQTVYALFADQSVVADVGSWITVATLLAASLGLVRSDPRRLDRHGLLALVPLAGAAVLGSLNLITEDTSAAAQVCTVLPTLWAASQLRPPGAWVVAGFSGTLNAVLVLHLEPLDRAIPDAAFVAATLLLATALLTHAGNRQERLVAELHARASIDPLTGLVTRGVLDTALARAVRGRRVEGTALVLVDVDRFKSINDEHGHPVGDDALRHLGAVLSGVVRGSDAVVSRMGGDELALLLPGCPTDVAARRAAELVAAVRANPLPLPGGGPLPLTVSVGVAVSPDDAEDVRSLYAAADSALYEAKRGGRDRAAAYRAPAPGPVTSG